VDPAFPFDFFDCSGCVAPLAREGSAGVRIVNVAAVGLRGVVPELEPEPELAGFGATISGIGSGRGSQTGSEGLS
jgi:hypothetical protein